MNHVSKSLRQAIMKRSYLEKTYFKKRTEHSLKAYKKKKIIAVAFIKMKRNTFSLA